MTKAGKALLLSLNTPEARGALQVLHSMNPVQELEQRTLRISISVPPSSWTHPSPPGSLSGGGDPTSLELQQHIQQLWSRFHSPGSSQTTCFHFQQLLGFLWRRHRENPLSFPQNKAIISSTGATPDCCSSASPLSVTAKCWGRSRCLHNLNE